MAFDPISSIAAVANTVLSRVLPDKPAQAAAQVELAKMQLSGELAQVSSQIEVDKTEAMSQSIFVAGWRPFVGWICGAGLGYQFLLRPLLSFVAALSGHHVDAPTLEMGQLMELLAGMLGLAGMRTVEKIQGCSTSQTGH